VKCEEPGNEESVFRLRSETCFLQYPRYDAVCNNYINKR